MKKKMWGGRFAKAPEPLTEDFSRSIHYDYKLAQYDLIGSMAHVHILGKNGYLSSEEVSRLKKALSSIYKAVENRGFKPDPKSEDIHTDIQNILQDKLGDVAMKLQMARSRNDQVVFAAKAYCKVELHRIEQDISGLISSLEETAKKNDIVIPGFTHMQHAQPVLLKDYLMAYAEMLKRDRQRLEYIENNIRLTMGAGALSGTPISSLEYSVNIEKLIEEPKGLGSISKKFYIEPTTNSLDSVSDRDFLIEIISALSIIAMHLSRFCEDLIIWSTEEFDFVEIDEAFCTGSSLMPQKKNPDILELIRGYTGRLYGNLVSVLVIMKGLPLAYNRDMQLDKEPLFESLGIISQALKILKKLTKTLRFNIPKISKHLKDESLYATDIVYYLVDKKVPFKEAHNIVGRLIRHSIEKSIRIQDMAQDELRRFSDKLVKKDMAGLFDPLASVKSKRSIKRTK